MTDAVLVRLRRLAQLLDDDALIALANRGLVRRARKDLRKEAPELEGVDEDRVRLQVQGNEVLLTEPPASSTCSCLAEGICRHILVGWMHLASLAEVYPEGVGGVDSVSEPEAEQASPLPELLAINDEALRRWAGTALLRRALRELGRGLRVQLEEGPPLVIRIADWNETVRWLPGAGLAGMLCGCHASEPCVHRVAAVLGAQVLAGCRELAIDDPLLRASEGAPRTRSELLEELGAVLAELVRLGLTRVSSATVGRLRTLATSAHGVDLPRLERVVQSLAREVELQLERHGQASSEALLLQAARAEALRRALEHPSPGIVGRHRGRYGRVGELFLIGMGARSFHTRSGYRGLTCYFWDTRAEGWATWSEARPATGGDFDPIVRYAQSGPWQGCTSPRQAATSTIRLAGAWRSTTGRLSGRESVRMVRVGASRPEQVPAIGDWRQVAERVRQLFAGGLSERNELGGVVHLQPAGLLGAAIDPIEQCWRAVALDANDRQLQLVLRYEEQRTAAVNELAQSSLEDLSSVLGLIRLRSGRIEVEPVSLVRNGTVHSLGFDTTTTPAADPQPPIAVGDQDADLDDEHGDPGAGGVPGQVLERLIDELVLLAERGAAAHAGSGLVEAVKRLERAGFTELAQLAGRLTEPPSSARRLLAATYVADTARALAAVEQACATVEGG